ncbi:DNA replication/repair protein RecF [Candidatus Peregrinibacteria bacterium]|nr:DNA replication/repair protein RecF [Candidatus Peregrinibacteria bacterium]
MRIQNIKIKGFRNLKGIDLKFDDGVPIHAFVGANGQGKTNILEAIYLCSLSKSFRTRTSADLVGFDEDFSSVRVDADGETLEVVVTAKPVQKVLKINGVKKSASDFIGNLKSVFFSPDDLAYMSYSPKLRRRYLDVVLSQLNADYLSHLMEYNEAIRQRNSLLKAIADGNGEMDELDFWDEKLAQLGSFITDIRGGLIDELQKLVSRHYKEISNSDSEIRIVYESEVRGVKPKELRELYKKNHRRDLAICQTKLGPHRDDLKFMLNGRDMTDFASRGEWRSLVLALKFAEIDLIKIRTGDDPVLLLDDVFSELDADRQKYLFQTTGKSQTFITTTHKEFIEGLTKNTQVYKVSEGAVT